MVHSSMSWYGVFDNWAYTLAKTLISRFRAVIQVILCSILYELQNRWHLRMCINHDLAVLTFTIGFSFICFFYVQSPPSKYWYAANTPLVVYLCVRRSWKNNPPQRSGYQNAANILHKRANNVWNSSQIMNYVVFIASKTILQRSMQKTA